LVIRDYKAWEGRSPQYVEGPWHAVMAAPLMSRDRLAGAIAVVHSDPARQFTPSDLRVLNLFAQQAAVAVENARLFGAEQQRREAAAALADITQAAGSSLELKQVLKHIAQRAAVVCRANRCSVFLLDDAGEYLRPVMSQFADGHGDRELWETFKATAADRAETVPPFREAIRERRTVLLDNPASTDLLPRKWVDPFGVRKLLIVPLVARDRVIGLMALDHADVRSVFTPEQVDLAQAIAGQVAASIENARLYARVQQLAITDGLTGLYNHRHFYQMLEAELARSQRYGRPCALLMLDLDDLKKYNDRYGHLAGDDLLQELADLIRRLVRQVDTGARYGGEEFAVILPETDSTQALAVAERLRETVRSHAFAVRGTQQSGRITVSIGVAIYPGDATDAEGLVNAADIALLRAKAEKDRVCVAGPGTG
jgi:diguanylate cyclase (GGDEF)-like protein